MIITPFNVCKFKFIGLFNHIIWLQYIQEQSRQTLLPGLKLFYGHPPLHRFFFCYNQASSSAKFPRALACSMTLASSIWGRVS